MTCVRCYHGPLFPVLEGEAAEIAARFVPGARVELVEHTYRPDLVGQVLRVERVGERLTTYRNSAGHRIRSSVNPDAHWIGPDTYRFHTICEDGVRHTATRRILAPPVRRRGQSEPSVRDDG